MLERQWEIIRRQLGGLDTSQRVAIGLCVAFIASSLFMLSQWSLQREMVPLYADSMSEEEREAVVRQLQMLGETYEDRADTVYVRPADRRRLIMALVERDTGPKTLSVTFDKLIKDKNVFASQQKTRWQQNIALQNELAMTIQSWPRIKDASVFIAPAEGRRRLNEANKPKATVQVRMIAGYHLDRGVVESLARVVSGAVPALEPDNVNVVDLVAGRSYRVDGDDSQFSSRLYELQKEKESQLQDKILDLLNYIPGINAQVTVKLDEKTVNRVNTALDEPVVKREVREESVASNARSGQEPGVSANTSVQLVGGGGGHSATEERSETDFMPERGGTFTETTQKPGTVLTAAASISVPRTYFIGALKALGGDAQAEPPADQIDTFIADQKEDIRNKVANILDAVAEEQSSVHVSVFTDQAVAFIEPPLAEPSNQAGFQQLFATYGREVGLATLALFAVGTMLFMLRRGADANALRTRDHADPVAANALGDLVVDGAPVGRAGSPDAFLIAQETDENSIRARQIAQQVSDLINDDPDGAAQLVRRWIERES